MKKIIALILSVVMLLGLSSCTSSKTEPSVFTAAITYKEKPENIMKTIKKEIEIYDKGKKYHMFKVKDTDPTSVSVYVTHFYWGWTKNYSEFDYIDSSYSGLVLKEKECEVGLFVYLKYGFDLNKSSVEGEFLCVEEIDGQECEIWKQTNAKVAEGMRRVIYQTLYVTEDYRVLIGAWFDWDANANWDCGVEKFVALATEILQSKYEVY